MAVVTVKSAAITNRDATPRVANNSIVEAGILRESIGSVVVTTGNTSTSQYRFCQIPSNARISQVFLQSDDMGTATVADFGLYDTTDNGGAVVDADFFGSAVSLKDGALNHSAIEHESAVIDVPEAEQMIWQLLGLSADPKKFYDVVATLTADSDAGGDMALKVQYVI